MILITMCELLDPLELSKYLNIGYRKSFKVAREIGVVLINKYKKPVVRKKDVDKWLENNHINNSSSSICVGNVNLNTTKRDSFEVGLTMREALKNHKKRKAS